MDDTLLNVDKGERRRRRKGGARTSSSESGIKSHPIRNLRGVKRCRRKGILLSRFLNACLVGLGGCVYYFGWRPRRLRVTPGSVAGFLVGGFFGLRLCKKYQQNRRLKILHGRILGLPLGEKGMFQMTSSSDGSMRGSEKVEYITRVLKLMWPFYEPILCKKLVSLLQPMLDEVKPHFIKRINLSGLRFGEIPFNITEVQVAKETEDEFAIDCGIKWHGNAFVVIDIDLKGGGSIQPKFERFKFYGDARLSFTQLVPHFPCFGAMTICLHSLPMVDFRVEVNQSVLSLLGDQVRQFLTYFITDHVFNTLLVWPARIVIPILPERQRGNIDHLELHTRGVLRVVVVEATGLTSRERYSSLNNHIKPFVVLETVPQQSQSTKVLPDGFHPVWREEHFLKVQELDQSLKVELFDDHFDQVDLSVKNASRPGRKIGGLSVPLKDLRPGKPLDKWFTMTSPHEDLNVAVRSKHYGQDILSEMWYVDKTYDSAVQLRLCLTYMPKEDLRQGKLFMQKPRSSNTTSHYGLLFVRLLRAYNLANVDYLSLSDPFCVLSLNSAYPKRTRTIRDCLDPEWKENYEWFNVSAKEHLLIEVFSSGRVVDTPLGFLKIPVRLIATECEREGKVVDTILPLTEGDGDIHLELDWVPLDNNLMKRKSQDWSALKAAPRGYLFVKLGWATSLINVGLVFLSSPYCIVKVKQRERRSSVVKNNLDPVWEEEFLWESVGREDFLEIAVWSRGTLQDSFLGKVEIRIADAMTTEPKLVERALFTKGLASCLI